MEYKFRCNTCNTLVIREIPMDKYDSLKDSQTCNSCGNRLNRVIEWSGSCGNTGGYDSVAGKASWQK